MPLAPLPTPPLAFKLVIFLTPGFDEPAKLPLASVMAIVDRA